jgi:hypothetical protein
MLLAIIATAMMAIVAAVWVGAQRQRRALAAGVDRLLRDAASAALPPGPGTRDSLPAPVARYLELALPQQSAIRIVRLRQAGTLRTDAGSDNWMAFEAEHTAAPAVIGFVWDARVRIAPLLHVRVRDAFLDGAGSGHVSLLSAFTIAADAATPEMNSGSLHRFLAEAVWYPTALLPGANLRWSAVDASRAVATLTDHGVSVSLEFHFAGTGEVAGIYTPARWGTFGGGYEQRAWEGHFRNYQRRGGILVPSEGDVGWYVDDEWRMVWRAVITAYEPLHSPDVRPRP